MNHGIMVELVAHIRGHYFLEVCNLEYGNQVIYNPGDTFIKVVTCKIVEYVTQEGVGLWD